MARHFIGAKLPGFKFFWWNFLLRIASGCHSTHCNWAVKTIVKRGD